MVQKSRRESELREAALNESMKRVRLEKEVQQERADKLKAEAKRQRELQEEFERTKSQLAEAKSRSYQDQKKWLRAKKEMAERRKEQAASHEKIVIDAGASARARMAPLKLAEQQARNDVQAMLDRKQFLAESPVAIRHEVAEAQNIIDRTKASAESQLQCTNLPRIPNPPTVSESRV